MAFDAIEIVIIGVILVVILMWGPGKIPQLAKAIGGAKKEYDLAAKAIANPGATLIQVASSPIAPAKPADDILVETARQLGIATEGKTGEEISQEIIWKSKAK